MKKKILTLLVMVTIVALVPTSVLYGQDIQGELTPEITWRIENGTLFISGKGVVPTTMFGARSAWNDYRSLFHAVNIEEGITFVGQNVFVGYKNITSLTVAESVKELAPNSFNSCKKLTAVEVKSAIPPDINVGTFYKVKFKKARLTVPAGTKATYQADPLWSKFTTIEESTQPPKVQSVAVESLATPCVIHLKRTSNFVGGGVNVKVFLNGVEQPMKLSNGQTILLETNRVQNELYLQAGKSPIVVRRFDATSGGDIRIEYSYFFGYMKIMEDDNDEE